MADSAEVRHNLAARTSSSELRRGQPWLRQEPPDKAKRGASPELEKVVSLNRGFVGTQRGLQANAVPRPAGPVSTAASRRFWHRYRVPAIGSRLECRPSLSFINAMNSGWSFAGKRTIAPSDSRVTPERPELLPF